MDAKVGVNCGLGLAMSGLNACLVSRLETAITVTYWLKRWSLAAVMANVVHEWLLRTLRAVMVGIWIYRCSSCSLMSRRDGSVGVGDFTRLTQ